jgi:hypothetical protein
MLLAVVTNFRASRKDPLAEVLSRIHGAFHDSGIGEPELAFGFGDAPVPGFVSSVDRVLKRFPQMQDFYFAAPPLPSMGEVRQISNGRLSPAVGKPADFATLVAIAQGVPRSFPFHTISFQFRSPHFGELVTPSAMIPAATPGIILGDSWWVNGRNRSLMALTIVDADPNAKKLPSTREPLASVLAACGKVSSVNQLQLPTMGAPPSVDPEIVRRVSTIVMDYRSRLPMIVEQAPIPHRLPSAAEARLSIGQQIGPKKPALDRSFKPLGYTCKGESVTFTLTRKTAANLTVEATLDVGTWSNNLTAFYEVYGVGFTARLPLPAGREVLGVPQYPIGDADRWQRIVENLAALVSEYDRTFVLELEAAAGPAPEWFKP